MTLPANFLEVFGFVTQATVLALLLNGLHLVLKRTQFSASARSQVWLGISVLVLAWYGLVSVLARHDFFRASPTAKSPILPLAVFAPVILSLWLIRRSKGMAKIVDATPLSWLVGAQAYRALGAIFLILLGMGQLPWQFALPAGCGDFLTGVLAIAVATIAGSGSASGRKAVYTWNVFGILDLVVALGMGFLTSPSPLQLLAFNHPNLLVSRYPLVMIPAFMVPLSLILHGICLWKLQRMAQPSTDLPVVPYRTPMKTPTDRLEKQY